MGKQADEVLIVLSEHTLNPRVIGLVEDNDREPGTILNQIPRAGSCARPHQTIFLVISTRSKSIIADNWVGMAQDMIQKKCATHTIKPIFIPLHHNMPVGICFVQVPVEGSVVTERPILYISAGSKNRYIWPSLIGAPAQRVVEMMKKQGIDVAIIGEYAAADQQKIASLIIIDQRPLPGSSVIYDGMHAPVLHIRLGKQ